MRRHEESVLSLYPHVPGLAFVVFAGPLTPVDWGTKEVRGPRKNAQIFRAAKRLIEIHRPVTLVLENITIRDNRRWHRARRLVQVIHQHAESRALKVHIFTRGEVRQSFASISVRTKHQVAQAVATDMPVFDPLLPRLRRRWDSEAYSMGILQAAALGTAFYYHRGRRKEKAP